MNDSPATELWAAYGLLGNPFFQEELLPAEESSHPVSLFVGRGDELRLLLRQLGGGPSSRAVVVGAPGVGKTSFANRAKAELAKHGVLTHETPVRIEGHTTPRGFAAEVLKVLLRIRSTHKLKGDHGFWTTIGRIIEGENIISGGIAGISVAQSRISPEGPSISLYDDLRQALQKLNEESGKRVLIHVNNLENLDSKGRKSAALLIRDLRDYFMLPGADWILVGATGIETEIISVYPQVSGIFPTAIVLQPLSSEKIADLLKLRYKHMKRGSHFVPPVEIDDAVDLYRNYRGDLRNFLRLLSDASQEGLALDGVRPLTRDEILTLMTPRRAQWLAKQIGHVDLNHIVTLFTGKNPNDEIRVTDVAERTGLSQGSASKLVERLVAAGVIIQTRTEVRNTYYCPSGDVLVALDKN